MGFEEMPQGAKQFRGVFHPAVAERGADVVNNHVADIFGTLIAVQQVARQGRSRDFRNMLMFGNSRNLIGRQAAKRDAII